ncbi:MULTISPECIES: glycoside hydrolase family 3 N-terminal domain-containing protein [unclassified Schaalia]|uniref:glycoside hydrolase family 3 N-terminal domain-containing protein n=1 Tax=unclassified Schaalia TaxID=2691889 RepID=UPI0018CAF58E|nr:MULTISPECIES: glycoside hydrolase family 3 N-terminal domain-containing protein [unclassified Schaalia]
MATERPKRRIGRMIFRILKGILKALIAVLIIALMWVTNTMLPGFSRMANSMLGGPNQSWDNSQVSAEGLDLDYTKADYDKDSITEAERDLDERITGEGYVLLKNDDQVMPFERGTTFSFFSEASKVLSSSQNMMTMLTGAKASFDGLNTALEAEGFLANMQLEEVYAKGACADYTMGPGSVGFGDGEDFSINECPLNVLKESGVLESAKNTVPVFVMKRVAGEGRDMPRSMYNHAKSAEDKARSYMEPDSTEREILQYLNDNFSEVLLVINTASALQLDWLNEYPSIKAVLSVPSAGTYGLSSFARILSGSLNPSGRTVDTWSGDIAASPAAQNFGDYQYVDANGELTKYNYVSYAEGIYVGYKYYETRYEDLVLGQGNAGDFTYSREVIYPFGYGLSYTEFAWSDFSLTWNGDEATATVTVTNTGSVAGKDVVEIYAQSPYTDYDKENSVEKSAIELVGYAKTQVLEPGARETVDVTLTKDQLKAYDSHGAKTYILDAGTYYVTAGRDAHDAVNNILAAKGKTEKDAMTAAGDSTLVAQWSPSNSDVDTTSFAKDPATGVAVTNLFDDAAGDITYLSRQDWTGTFPRNDGEVSTTISTWGNEINGTDQNGEAASFLYTKEASPELIAKLDSTESGNPDDLTSITDTPVYGANHGLTLASLRGADFDDPKWDQLLDQLTPADYQLSIARGGYGTEPLKSVGKPFSMDADTAAGLIYGGTGMMFATPITLAQTWNPDIASEYGKMIGNEALLGGANGWYAPSMNIHRSAYSGRNGEYFSEDAFLSGAIAAAEVKGAASKGMYATIKHFALNDQENHRGDREGQYSIATWANEQSIREIYVKPFEMVMKVGNVDLKYTQCAQDGTCHVKSREYPAAAGIMTGFNRIGATWTGGSYPLLTGLVRNEWGFDGWIITDNANTGVFMDAHQMLLAGGDTKLTTLDQSDMWTFDENDPVEYHYGRAAMHRLLYTIAHSHVMNGSMPGSELTYGMQKVDQIRLGVAVVGGIILILLAWTTWRNHKKYARERAQRRQRQIPGSVEEEVFRQ